uniref:Uncharacterized protein n=1 Tax=Parascaris equorum TaxID=6256 RepID=A0A914RQD0_PAREQ
MKTNAACSASKKLNDPREETQKWLELARRNHRERRCKGGLSVAFEPSFDNRTYHQIYLSISKQPTIRLLFSLNTTSNALCVFS